MSLILLLSAVGIHLTLASASNTTDATTSTRADLIPWKWYIKPDIPNYVCPSPASTLGTFAAVNILVTIANLVFGHRRSIQFFTCGLRGRSTGKSTWWFMFLFPLCIQLCANALIAYLYRQTPGYGQGFSIGELTLFYTTRPRLGWIPLSILMSYGRKYEGDTESQPVPQEGTELQDTSNNRKDDSIEFGFEKKVATEGYYEASAKGVVFAEVFLLLISTYYTGMTAHFASTRGYYIVGRLQGPYCHNARIMYAGALMSLVSLFPAIVYLLMLLAPPDTQWAVTDLLSFSILRNLPITRKNRITFLFVWSVACTSWLASWLFWAGYVSLAGDLYCPPKLVASGAIWTTFSAFGTLFGVGH